MSIKSISEFLNPVPQGILVTAPELQEEMLGTKVKRYFTCQCEFISITCLSTGTARLILVTAPELQEDGMVQVLFTISLLTDIPQLGATRDVTAPEIARGVPLPVYMNF